MEGVVIFFKQVHIQCSYVKIGKKMDIFYGGLFMNIGENQSGFLSDFTSFKHELVNSLKSTNINKYREDYKGRYNPERFREIFIEKAALHMLFKYMLIRMIEDSMKIVKVKLSMEGLEKWHEMSKNFRKDYDVLYEMAIDDVRREQDFQEVFRETVYDNHNFFNSIKPVIKKQIPLLAKYDFDTLEASTTLTVIDTLYGVEERMEIQKLEPSFIIDFLLQQVGLD